MAHNGTIKWPALYSGRLNQAVLQRWFKSPTEASLSATPGLKTNGSTGERHAGTADGRRRLALFPNTIWGSRLWKRVWRAAAGRAHRRVRVIGHHRGYDGSLESIGGDQASVHRLAEYRGKVIHVLERSKQTQYGITIVNTLYIKLFLFCIKWL